MPTSDQISQARAMIERWFLRGVEAVDPAIAVRRALDFDEVVNILTVNGAAIPVQGDVVLIALGKAAVPMAAAAAAILGDRLTSGVVITKDGHATDQLPEHVDLFEASHPIPDQRGVHATSIAIDRVSGLGPDDVVLALISGGGSALFEAPVPPLTLADIAATTDALLRAGAPIQDLNAVRIPLSQVKGGGFRAAAPDATFATLILSDVLSNDVRTIASGPTVPATANAEAALEVLRRYGVASSVPPAVLTVLQNISTPEHRAHPNDLIAVIADNAAALAGIRSAALADGMHVEQVWHKREGEAAELGRAWVAACRGADPSVDVLLGGGEATVTVRGSGSGGRNTEFALAAAIDLAENHDEWVVASLATDGQDALTGAAGAIADPLTVLRAEVAGIEPRAALRDNDSLAVFDAAGGTVITGPTGTNVNDCYIAVRCSSIGGIR